LEAFTVPFLMLDGAPEALVDLDQTRQIAWLIQDAGP